MSVQCPYCCMRLNGHVARCPYCTSTFRWRYCPTCQRKVPTRYDLYQQGMIVRIFRGWYRNERRCIYCAAVLEAWNSD